MTDEERTLSVRLPVSLYEQLRRYAFDRRIPQADVIREGLKRILADSDHDSVGSTE